jgi:signal peptidase I
MEPTVSKGAHVLVNELAYRTGPVKRGDIVVFVNPNERAQRYIKRVVALAGETVEMRGDDVFIDGAMLLHESGGSLSGGDPTITEANGGARYRVFPASSKDSLDSGVPKALAATRVPAGHCFVLGDDRRHSIDSRSVGPVPLADIVGRVDYVW